MQAAVYAKNYGIHLEDAARIGASNPEQWVVFRSSVTWSSAHKLLEAEGAGAVPIVFGVVDGGPWAEYQGRLQEVHLRPSEDNPRTKELLDLRPPSTEGDEPLKDGRQTLYAISGCRKLETPIPFSQLLKQDNGEPLSPDFKYSYALIQLPDVDEFRTTDIGTDVAPAPSRINTTVSRIVRDTALIRQLKARHNDTCQVCATRLDFGSGRGYSEGHHIVPLGRPHEGPDVAENVLVLCPNCHALCDNAAIKLDPSDLRTVPGHTIGDEFLKYHNRMWKKRRASQQIAPADHS